jgi:hypothetical protein
MVADPAELVAHDAEYAALCGREGDDVLIARVNRDVDVRWLQGKSMLPIN